MTYRDRIPGFVGLLKSQKFLGDSFVEASFKKKAKGHDITIVYKDAWGDDKTFLFFARSSDEFQQDEFEIRSFCRKPGKCDISLYYRKGLKVQKLLLDISLYIKKCIRGSKKEVVAFHFFSQIAKKNALLGQPERASREDDISRGTDMFIPVKKRNRDSYVRVPIDITGDPKYFKQKMQKNKSIQRKVSVLCFSNLKSLWSKRRDIERFLVRHGRRQKPFNLNI